MNEDLGKIYKIVNDIKVDLGIIKTKQELNHQSNQKDIGRLYKWLWGISILFVGASMTITISAIAG